MEIISSRLVHCVWAAKDGLPLIKPDFQRRLSIHIGGFAFENNIRALQVTCMEDHVHALLHFPVGIAVARAVTECKRDSCEWVLNFHPENRGFAWQEGFGFIPVGMMRIADTIQYLSKQFEYHLNVGYFEEMQLFKEELGMQVEADFK